MDKTIKEWLKHLPQPFKKEAIQITKDSVLRRTANTLSSAIGTAYNTWLTEHKDTSKWGDIQYRAMRGEFDPVPECVPSQEPITPVGYVFKEGDIVMTHKPALSQYIRIYVAGSMDQFDGAMDVITRIDQEGRAVVHGFTWELSQLTLVR